MVMIYFCYENYSAFSQGVPSINDQSLQLDLVLDGIQSPTCMAFLSDNLILITQKEGIILKSDFTNPTTLEPVFELGNANCKNERGLLGVAVDKNIQSEDQNEHNQPENLNVFIFVTETGGQEEQDSREITSNNELRNRVYEFSWDGKSLLNPTVILDLPAGLGTKHQGGKIKIGPDDQLYAISGELQREGQLQNINDGPAPDESGVIFRVNPEWLNFGE